LPVAYLVPNHTADDHAWFVESSSSRNSAKADWYIWADAGEDGAPPNNWLSRFGGSAWEWCEARRQYFYHSFLVEQPDLNWRNPDVRAAMADVMRFWLDRGIDGFRVDASAVLIKDELLRDNPKNPQAEGKPPPQRNTPVFTDDRPETMQCIEFIRQILDIYPGRLLCGEVQGKTDRIGHFLWHRPAASPYAAQLRAAGRQVGCAVVCKRPSMPISTPCPSAHGPSG
jgi:alpha-glucosidase